MSQLRTNKISYKTIQEYFSFCVGSSLLFTNGYYILKYSTTANLLQTGFMVICSMITADFISGIVHWTADTWGSTDLPFIGWNFLKPFREHHIDPTGITKRSFIITNSYNFFVTIPFLSSLLYKFIKSTAEEIQKHYNWFLYLYILGVFVSITNQIHKWSHTYSDLPRIVTILQKCHIILPQKHHRYHHIAPHETYYCITTGWLNYPLEKINFWTTLEKFITKLTGIQPRIDDLRWAHQE